jgi:signal transduction histidine kinase
VERSVQINRRYVQESRTDIAGLLSHSVLYTLLLWAFGLMVTCVTAVVSTRFVRNAEIRDRNRSQDLEENNHRLAISKAQAGRAEEEARQAVRDRDEFLSVASHELRTPLTSLQLIVQSLDRLVRQGKSEQLMLERFPAKLASIGRQVERLSTLVNNLLDVSRLDAKRLALEYESFDLSVLAQDVAERFHEQACELNAALTVRADRAIEGRWDRLKLDQVLVNLVSNALKFGNGKPIEVIVSGDAQFAKVVVRDLGIGILHQDQRRIFQRFERGGSAHRYAGLGLGLWLSQQFVNAMGGGIEVESSPGAGSTFTVTLPRAPAETVSRGLDGATVLASSPN